MRKTVAAKFHNFHSNYKKGNSYLNCKHFVKFQQKISKDVYLVVGCNVGHDAGLLFMNSKKVFNSISFVRSLLILHDISHLSRNAYNKTTKTTICK